MHWKSCKFGAVVAMNVIFVVFVVGRVVWRRHFNQGSEPELSGHVSVVRLCGTGVSE